MGFERSKSLHRSAAPATTATAETAFINLAKWAKTVFPNEVVMALLGQNICTDQSHLPGAGKPVSALQDMWCLSNSSRKKTSWKTRMLRGKEQLSEWPHTNVCAADSAFHLGLVLLLLKTKYKNCIFKMYHISVLYTQGNLTQLTMDGEAVSNSFCKSYL